MSYQLSLTTRHTLFLAVVMLAMLLGSSLITGAVVKKGLKELLQNRLEYAGRSLEHFAILRDMTRASELRSIFRSPRFIAAVETGHKGTISEEAPDYMTLIGADYMVITDNSGNALYLSKESGELKEMVHIITLDSFADTVVADWHGNELFESFLSDVVTSDGFAVGRVGVGFKISDQIVKDVQQLTGFDAIATMNNRLLSFSKTTLMTELVTSTELEAVVGSSIGRVAQSTIAGEEFLHLSLPLRPHDVIITLVSSIEEQIKPILLMQRSQMSLLALVAAVFSISLIYLVTRRHIGRQIGQLVMATERISNDELDFRIVPQSSDEFGYLASQLEKMRSNLLQNRLDLSQAHAEQIQAERLASIGQVATGIIHDFKNPVAVIRMSAELSMKHLQDQERLVRYNNTIRDQVDTIINLCEEILDYARGNSNLEKSKVSLTEYVAEICTRRQQELDSKGITLKWPANRPVIVWIDPSRLRRVIDNLISNAIDVLSNGDMISIDWRSNEEELELIVADNGPGIPEAVRATLFEPFVTCGKESGTGLGLAICRKIVEDHGGEIHVDSTAEFATCFTISLPGAIYRKQTTAIVNS